MGDVGAEVQALDERKNIISGEFRQFNVLVHFLFAFLEQTVDWSYCTQYTFVKL